MPYIRHDVRHFSFLCLAIRLYPEGAAGVIRKPRLASAEATSSACQIQISMYCSFQPSTFALNHKKAQLKSSAVPEYAHKQINGIKAYPVTVGVGDGSAVGVVESVGSAVGSAVGVVESVGSAVGSAVGVVESVGSTVGSAVGVVESVGSAVGSAVGVVESVGSAVGAGDSVGPGVGVGVGPSVTESNPHSPSSSPCPTSQICPAPQYGQIP